MSPLSRRFHLVLAPCLLCAVAMFQIAHVRFSRLTPWKGGGFGMFSTVDSAGARFVKIYLETATGQIATSLDAPEPELLRKIEAVPASADVQRLAAGLSAATWVDVDQVSGQPQRRRATNPRRLRPVSRGEPEPDSSVRVNCRTVRVEVWKYRFVPADDQLQAEKIIETTAAAPPR